MVDVRGRTATPRPILPSLLPAYGIPKDCKYSSQNFAHYPKFRLGWTIRSQPNLCVSLAGLQIYAISPRAAPGLAARLTLGFYVSPPGFCRFAAVNVMDTDYRMLAWRPKGPAT